MQKNNPIYIFIFALGITAGCGILLAIVSEATRTARETNVRVEKMSNILATVNHPFEEGADNQAIENAYGQYIEELVVNEEGETLEGERAFNISLKDEKSKANANADYERKLPVFIYTSPENGDKYYVMPLRGNGLWGAVWGYLSLKSDLQTVYGVKFDHESETPGLGAEITTDWFQSQFPGKTVFGEEDKVALTILKGRGNQLGEHTVDGISGATITGNGVNAMLKQDLSSYTAYFNKLKNS